MSNVKVMFKSFGNFLSSRIFLKYFLSVLLFALVFLFSGYALTNNESWRTYFYVILVLFAFILLIYHLLTIQIPSEKKNAKSILKHYFQVAKTDVSLYYLLFVIFSSIISMIVNKDFDSNGLKSFVTNTSMFVAAFAFTKVVGFKESIRVYRKIFPWICLVSLGMFGLIYFFQITQPFLPFETSVAQYNNYLFVYFKEMMNRNGSIFWEPALFALFISFATICEIALTEKKIRIWVIAIYLLSLVTTFSSSGFIIFIASLIISIVAAKNDIIKSNFIGLLIMTIISLGGIVGVVLLNPDILKKFEVVSQNGSLLDRLFGPYINLRIMLDHPFGVGFSKEYSYFLEYASSSGLLSSPKVQTCAFGYWASAFGFLGLLFTIIPMVLLFFNKKISIYTKIIIIPLALLFMMAEPIQNNLAFLILIFYSLNECTIFRLKKANSGEEVETTSILNRVLKNKNNSTFVKNSLSAFIVKGLAMLISLFTTSAYITYFMDPKGEGMLAVWFTILSVLTWILVFDLGVGHGLKNKLIAAYEENDENKIKNLISSSYFFAFIVSLIIFAGGSLLIWLLNPYGLLNANPLLIDEYYLKLSLWIILIGICLNFVLKIICNIFESLQKQGLSNLFAVFNSLILIIYVSTFILSNNEERMLGLSIAYLIGSTLPYLIGSIILFSTRFKEYIPSFKSISFNGIKSVVTLGGLFFVIQLCMLLINNTNTIVIQHVFNDIESGATSQFTYYQKIFNVIVVVSQLLSGPLWVIIAKAKSSDDSRYIRKMNRVLLFAILGFIVIDLFAFATMPIIFEIWIPNASFEFSWMANAVFAFNAVIVTATILWASVSNGLSKLKYQTIGFFIGLCLKVGSVIAIVVLINNGTNIPWYVIELTTTLAYIPVLILVPIGNYKYLSEVNNRPGKIFFYSYFRDLVRKDRNAPLASENISLYVKEILDKAYPNTEYVNLAHSKKPFVIERNVSIGNNHQIGTVSFGKAYRKYIWKKNYWKKIYRFSKKHNNKNDVLIFYHSLYTSHLFKKIKDNIGCKIILIGAELYSDVTSNKKDKRLEIESYQNSNAHILISKILKEKLQIDRPGLILSGDYRPVDIDKTKFSKTDKKVHVVYAGTFDEVKGGVYASIDAMEHLDDKYVLHILGFGDVNRVKEHISKVHTKAKIILEEPLYGNELISFLSKCDIGLSVQNPEREFNNSSFPSKIVTYLKSGLLVVSSKSISVQNSPFEKAVKFVDFDSKSIAEAIEKISAKKTSKIVNTLYKQFNDEFVELIKQIDGTKRILITNNCFGGSTGNISQEISEYLLAQGYDVKFCYLKGKRKTKYYAHKYGSGFEHYLSPLLTRLTGNHLGYMLLSTSSLKRITKKYKPDLVNIHCMNSYSVNIFRYLKYLKKNKHIAVITNHALFYATGSCGHPLDGCERYKTGCGKCPNKRRSCKSLLIDRTKRNWLKMFKTLNDSNFVMTSVSNFVKDVCTNSPITNKLENRVILNSINTSTFKYYGERFNDGKIHILHVNSAAKNIYKGFDQFLKIVDALKDDEKYVFHIVGKELPKLSKYRNISVETISSKEELARLYSKCDLSLITSKNETFSLPAVESVCSGTPIVGFRCGGPESFLTKDEAMFFVFGDIDSMVSYIKKHSYLSVDKAELSEEGVKKYSLDVMCDSYFSLFEELTVKDDEKRE